MEATGSYDFSGSASDHALLVSTTGAAALIIASYIREKYLLNREIYHTESENKYIHHLYEKYRTVILSAFVLLFVATAGSNIWLGIYQRGLAPQTILPYGLKGVYTWLLLFGLTSFSAVIIESEFKTKKNIYLVAIIGMLENFCSSVSMLSRAMILNSSALMLGAKGIDKDYAVPRNRRFKIIVLLVFAILFIGSIFTVNTLRVYKFNNDNDVNFYSKNTVNGVFQTSYGLFVNRWVGIEGVLAVSSYPNLGWNLWADAWQEIYSDYGTSLYDKRIAEAKHNDMDSIKHHFISMPGILSFFYYPGSLMYLFAAMFILGILGAAIEIAVYKICQSNLILCSIMAEVIAYRYAHFGYVPRQSYLLFGTIILNVLIIYMTIKLCKHLTKTFNERKNVSESTQISS